MPHDGARTLAARLFIDAGGTIERVPNLTREKVFVREDGCILILIPYGASAIAADRMIAATITRLLIEHCDYRSVVETLSIVLRGGRLVALVVALVGALAY